MKKTCLIAGGAGKFGSRLAEKLAANGWQCVSFDDLSTGSSEKIKHGPLVKTDVREKARLVRTMKEYSITHVFHCALWPDDSTVEVGELYQQNLQSILSLTHALQEIGGGQLTVINRVGRTNEMMARMMADAQIADARLRLRFVEGLGDDEALQAATQGFE